jgi:hypothetical protein
VIGVTNGIYQAEYDSTSFSSKVAYEKFTSYFHKFGFKENSDMFNNANIEIQFLNALRNAKVTDFLSYSPHIPFVPFLISLEAKAILDTFFLPKHRYFKTNIRSKSLFSHSDKAFFFFFCPHFESVYVNFTKSQLSENKTQVDNNNKATSTLIPHDIKSEEHYEVLIRKLSSSRLTRVCLNPILKKYDIIPLNLGYTLISDSLKSAIEKDGLSGLIFKDIDVIFD